MMKNSSQVSYFTLAAYLDSGDVKFLYFVVLLTAYVLIIGANVFLMVVICMNRSLHEPMYMFLLSLFVNELYGSTGLFPFLLVQILSDLHTVAAPLCFLQVFIIYSYGGVEYLSLTAMSYDRYVAVCCPLRYKTLMTADRTATLIVLTWSYPLVLITVMVCLSSSLQLCGNVINKVYCDNYSVVKLSCSDASVNNIYGLVTTFCTIVFPLILIIFTYIKIFRVCLHGSKQTRQKAISTCAPHLAVLLNFSFGACFETLQSRFDMSRVPTVLRIFLSLYSVASLPLFNPLIYGLNVSKIRLGACDCLTFMTKKCLTKNLSC
uniref:Olfactory receptor n=1 Tax=Amphiprion percula TaxID=161767 RepID=A0A3P8TXQ5_AMPPE